MHQKMTPLNKLLKTYEIESLIRSDGVGQDFVVVSAAALGGGRVVESCPAFRVGQSMDLGEIVRQVPEWGIR